MITRSTSDFRGMNLLLLCAAVYGVFMLVMGGALMRAWSASDTALLVADDRRVQLAAAAQCHHQARLWQDPLTGELACVYRNADGDALFEPVLDSPIALIGAAP